MKNLEHIGIAVKDISKASLLYEKLLGSPSYKTEQVDSENVKTMFFKVADVKIELLESMNEDSAIAKFIAKKGEGIHHLAFEVEDIEQEIQRLKEEGFKFVSEVPKRGADNKRIVFLHPKSSGGVLIELCQEIRQ